MVATLEVNCQYIMKMTAMMRDQRLTAAHRVRALAVLMHWRLGLSPRRLIFSSSHCDGSTLAAPNVTEGPRFPGRLLQPLTRMACMPSRPGSNGWTSVMRNIPRVLIPAESVGRERGGEVLTSSHDMQWVPDQLPYPTQR